MDSGCAGSGAIQGVARIAGRRAGSQTTRARQARAESEARPSTVSVTSAPPGPTSVQSDDVKSATPSNGTPASVTSTCSFAPAVPHAL